MASLLPKPAGGAPIGYAKVIADHDLAVMLPHQLSFVAASTPKRVEQKDGRELVTYRPSYDPGPELCNHLEFALKHEGVSLSVLSALFRSVEPVGFEAELCRHIQSRPTGQYARRLWFLYEFLTGRRLPLEDATRGNYIPLLDPSLYYTAPEVRSRRHLVLDNLWGKADFCPLVRRTSLLQKFQAEGLAHEAAQIVASYDEDALRRAVSYLYTKETRSSFDIERETPSRDRAERFVALLRSVPSWEHLDEASLVQMQNLIVDERFAEPGYRTDQNYVGESVGLRQRIHYIPPRPEDVSRLMSGLLACLERMAGSGVDPVVMAAVISFGFVFIHPFLDGNGRLHRLLIHYVLARTGFTPAGLIFPISAVMLQKRAEYDACLESFSEPLMQLVDYETDNEWRVSVRGDTGHLYQYLDYTRMAENLYRWTEETIRKEFRSELDFVVRYREAREKMDRIVEMPDRMRNLFIQLCLQNGGRLSAAKRTSHFSRLTNEELHGLEQIVQEYLVAPPGPVADP